MTIEAYVENGQVILPGPLNLPDGTKVTVQPILSSSGCQPAEDTEDSTLYERMKSVIGISKDLPPDASRNVDHYLYGHPKT